MAMVEFLSQLGVGLGASDDDFLGIDDDHEITQLNTRGKSRFVLSQQESGDLGCQAPEGFPVGIHQQPLAVYLSSFRIIRFNHFHLSKIQTK